jgi:hypothetical protein
MRDIEQELVDLGTHLDVPAPDSAAVAAAVRARLSAGSPPRDTRPAAPAGWRGRTLLVAAAVLVFALTTALALSSSVRAAAGDLLRFAGVDVTWGETAAPVVPESPLPSTVELNLTEARQVADFPIDVPDVLGEPQTVVVSDGGRVVSLLYDGATPIRLDEFDGTLDPIFVKVTLADARHVDLGHAEGLWVPEPHAVIYQDADGQVLEETARLSGQTLIWQSPDGVTLRLEGDFTLAEAAEIAASTR